MKEIMSGVLILVVLVAAGQVLSKIIAKKFDELMNDWSL